jgi:hypothetical protein
MDECVVLVLVWGQYSAESMIASSSSWGRGAILPRVSLTARTSSTDGLYRSQLYVGIFFAESLFPSILLVSDPVKAVETVLKALTTYRATKDILVELGVLPSRDNYYAYESLGSSRWYPVSLEAIEIVGK